ncbi:hypothetical protein AA23498_2026 [Acetobacter nitrogenifigens DSM 23921 = NBRC 105050]|uniref:Uncharacterized protein n=1 Tax=Acetobacter nitrogenifigens DSM 23921 = NBRC 105050 TaxID=1120919 RepID=A0A511X6F2_9PROT|nr:hypothetical protein [Acetobacter nitrogenifigens]GBQ94424.1 hypothetical protein AA23498_2026 [Acetobacter nitrogenifigens DSM 23921 = NBRC 105050]GEN58519.1 hypothetical protein ANI02nite_04030 [Acetobacter nitrogenifigens DSM 23921 = NBRC 105050]
MSGQTAQDVLRPRLKALIAQAEVDGIAPDVTISLLLNLLETEDFGVPTPPEEDA